MCKCRDTFQIQIASSIDKAVKNLFSVAKHEQKKCTLKFHFIYILYLLAQNASTKGGTSTKDTISNYIPYVFSSKHLLSSSKIHFSLLPLLLFQQAHVLICSYIFAHILHISQQHHQQKPSNVSLNPIQPQKLL